MQLHQQLKALYRRLQRVLTAQSYQTGRVDLRTNGARRNIIPTETAPGKNAQEGHAGTVDITQRKRANEVLEARLRLGDYARGHSLDQLLIRTLDEADRLTGSTFGFLHFVEADQKALSLQTRFSSTLQKMCRSEGKGRFYDADKAGIWVDALRERRPMIHNDCASPPHRKGLPPSHAPVFRELVVPILRNEQVVALLGIGNKPCDYGPEDTTSVSQFANLAWDIVLTKRAEEALKKSRRLLAETEWLGKVGGRKDNIAIEKQTWTEKASTIHGKSLPPIAIA